MGDMKKRGSRLYISLPHPSSADLRGKQSVRATFKLTERAIEALSIVAVHLGIKQKSLFDHLLEDAHSLSAIAQGVERQEFSKLQRVQKTYVLSRRTLHLLDQASKSHGAPRDALVEYSIQRLESVIANEREKHRKRKMMLVDLAEHWRQGEELLRKSRMLLGEDDPVSVKIEDALNACKNTYTDIELFVERGKIIEQF